ncbi:sensor histidine kinase [Dysosmobacter sp.]|uniref:sensor histidine kinase n=1 Tax=Dysosmobacter sp. TaxID=2591382 RepID=UPI002A8E6627|nr:hypothetical protein [Dysosmobacter sp.]MDY3281248.1 hypothetical protein [Dysosmobacter sp.]
MRLFHRKPGLGRSSVKEGFDNLPSAICFAGAGGTILLCNRQMYHLCHILMGMDLQHMGELRRALDQPRPGVEVLDRAARLYRFPDGTCWQFSETSVTDAEGEDYTQVQAIDVTELREKQAELERDNAALAEANRRARQLYAELDRIVREKETLAMKIRVHDDMGQCLLATRKLLLTGDAALEDYRTGGRRWAETLGRITAAGGGRDSGPDTLPALLASAAEIGVRVRVTGKLPQSAENARLMIAAMRECATNTVRHAGGSEMTVELARRAESDIAVITNNGTPPEGEIVEGGGLSGLRRRVEHRQGTMTVEGKPAFRLTIVLPGKEEQG